MNAKGLVLNDVMIWIAILVIVIGLVGFGVTKAFGGSGGFIDFAKLIPGGNSTRENVVQGSHTIGIDLNDPHALKYYTSTTWEIYTDKEVVFNGIKANKDEVVLILFNFYFRTERKPALEIYSQGVFFDPVFVNPVDTSRIWLIGNIAANTVESRGLYYSYDNLIIRDQKRAQYVKENDQNSYFRINSNDNLYQIEKGEATSKIVQNFGNAISGSHQYADVAKKVITWRDSIVQGGACEKYVNVFGNSYSVRKVKNFLVIDLDSPVTGTDKYTTCQLAFDSDDIIPPKSDNKNYTIDLVSFNVEGQSRNHAFFGEELSLEIKHDCEYINVLVRMYDLKNSLSFFEEGVDFITREHVTNPDYMFTLPTDKWAKYSAFVSCYNKDSSKVRETEYDEIEITPNYPKFIINWDGTIYRVSTEGQKEETGLYIDEESVRHLQGSLNPILIKVSEHGLLGLDWISKDQEVGKILITSDSSNIEIKKFVINLNKESYDSSSELNQDDYLHLQDAQVARFSKDGYWQVEYK